MNNNIIKEVSLVILDMVLGVFYYYKIVIMLCKEEVIKFLGYLYKNYERNINYIWYVIVSDDIEEIFIEIMMDIY